MKVVKAIIDFLMLAAFVLLLNLDISGVALHEILGLVVFGLLIVHLILNMKWTVNVIRNFKKVKPKAKLILIIDAALFVLTAATLITGMLVSEFVFNFEIYDIYVVSQIHNWLALIAFVVILIHLGMHLKAIFSKVNNAKTGKKAALAFETAIYCCLSLLLCLYAFRDVVFSENPVETASYSFSDSKNISENEQPLSQVTESSNAQTDEPDYSQPNNESESNNIIDSSSAVQAQKENSEGISEQMSSQQQTEPAETIEEYLSKLSCDGCRRECSLASPRCNKGKELQQQAIEEYNMKYGTNVTY